MGPIVRPKYEGFFINSGNIEFITEEESTFQQTDQNAKNPKLQIDPETDAAIQHLYNASQQLVLEEGKFPKSLESSLSEVAVAAQKSHPRGYITNDVVSRLTQFLPFPANSIRNRMKRLLKKEVPQTSEEKNKKENS